MNYSITLHGKTVNIVLNRRTVQALGNRDKPITAVVHLIFGCMVAKRVWFREQAEVETVVVTDKLNLHFDVVRYANCSLKNIDGGAEPERFPIGKDISDFVPDALVIDYRRRRFTGDFTYQRMPREISSKANEPDEMPGGCATSRSG